MTTTAPLEIKVVFDASSRRRHGATARRALPRSRQERSPAWMIIAVVNFLVAALSYYVIWWRADPEIYLTLMMKTPVGMDLDMAAGIFVPSSQPKRAAPSPAPPVEEGPSSQLDARTAQWLIPATAYGWLTLATTAACATALAAGAAGVRARGPHWRAFGRVTSALILLGLVVGSYVVWRQYGVRYLPSHLRVGMGGLVLLAAAIGMAVGRGAAGLSRLAAFTLILAAAATAAGLHLGAKAGALDPRYATPTALAQAFALHSAYGWVLLAAVWRIAR